MGVINELPKLIPLYGHRYMISGDSNGVVISFHGPLDTILYADNLRDYLYKEFGGDSNINATAYNEISGFWKEVIS